MVHFYQRLGGQTIHRTMDHTGEGGIPRREMRAMAELDAGDMKLKLSQVVLLPCRSGTTPNHSSYTVRLRHRVPHTPGSHHQPRLD